jgi:hypothetical protein
VVKRERLVRPAAELAQARLAIVACSH